MHKNLVVVGVMAVLITLVGGDMNHSTRERGGGCGELWD